MSTPIDHATFREQIAAALAGGLSAAELAAFDAHAAACEPCAAEHAAAREAEARMTALFAGAAPVAGFEDRVIQRLRLGRERRNWMQPNWVHPAVRKAVTGVAAAVLLGGFGFVATQVIEKEQNGVAYTASGYT
ncbi:MAG: zf-HC2 domain-containing protein, partial [Tepidisphaeraceae bacterium]